MGVQSRLKRFAQKSYRDSYLDTRVKGGIAYQVQALRKKAGLTQAQFGKKIKKPQNVVSRLEDTMYGAVNVSTLLQIARENDVALIIRFASYPEFLEQTSDMSEEALWVPTIHESIEAEEEAKYDDSWTGEKVVMLPGAKVEDHYGFIREENTPRKLRLGDGCYG